MDIEQARKIRRRPIRAGRRYEFHSTMQGEVGGVSLRNYTGQCVTVIERLNIDDPEVEPLFRVRAGDGVEFDAYEGELNGWYRDVGPTYGPVVA